MKQRPTRTEDDLRAAFQLAAQDAPAPADVLAGIDGAEKPVRPGQVKRHRWGTWAPLAAVAVVIIAIVVPVAVIAHNSSGQKSASSAAGKAVFGAAASAPGDAASSAGNAGPNAPLPSAGGVVTPGPDVSEPGVGQPTDVCRAADVTASLHWTSQSGGLEGVVTLTNHTSATCEVLGKPSILPLDAGGKPLEVQTMVSAEGRIGQTHLVAGASASATISWPSWCGKPAGKTVEVDWGAGPDPLIATGPTTPTSCNANSANGGNNISSEWFNPLS